MRGSAVTGTKLLRFGNLLFVNSRCLLIHHLASSLPCSDYSLHRGPGLGEISRLFWTYADLLGFNMSSGHESVNGVLYWAKGRRDSSRSLQGTSAVARHGGHADPLEATISWPRHVDDWYA